MPTRLRFQITGPTPRSPYQHATGLRAVVLRWIAAADPQRAEEMHDSSLPKPYSLSPLQLPLASAEPLAFEVGVLDDRLVPLMLTGAEHRGPEVALGRDHFKLLSWQPVAQTAWEELRYGQAGPRELEVRLLTPTAHHTGARVRKSVVLPSPELYFGGWLRRWNLYAPPELRLDETLAEWVEEYVAVAECSGHTEAVPLDAGRLFVGFVGQVRFTFLRARDVPEPVRAALATLAHMAEFAGTGVETMRGMGLTKLVET